MVVSMKQPKYNPLAMSSLTYAKEYGKKMKKYFDIIEKKSKEANKNLNKI
jgi:hypothetical protein